MLAAELVHRPAVMIFASGLPSVFAAKAATSTIPIVFTSAGDPCNWHCRESQPAGRQYHWRELFAVEVVSKRLELLLRGSAYSHGDRPADKPE